MIDCQEIGQVKNKCLNISVFVDESRNGDGTRKICTCEDESHEYKKNACSSSNENDEDKRYILNCI